MLTAMAVQSISLNHRINKKKYTGLIYILPWLIGFLGLQLYPFIMSFIYSLTEYSILKEPAFVGFKNYKYMFTLDRDFWKSLYITFLYVIMAVPAKLVFALFIAMLLNMKIKFVNFYRTIYYLPSILGSSIAVSILWRYFFMRAGVINNMLGALNIKPIDWLGLPQTALFTISLLTVWQYGSSMVIFLAGLKQIPKSMYESARIDGASSLKVFFFITLPSLSPIIFFNLIMQTIYAFQEFTAPFVVTKGGPMKYTYLYGMMLYDQGFKFFNMGYACALSWIFFIVITIITLLIFKSSSMWVYYESEAGS